MLNKCKVLAVFHNGCNNVTYEFDWENDYGEPTDASLENFIMDKINSFTKKGGENYHHSEKANILIVFHKAVAIIGHQKVAQWIAPNFMAI